MPSKKAADASFTLSNKIIELAQVALQESDGEAWAVVMAISAALARVSLILGVSIEKACETAGDIGSDPEGPCGDLIALRLARN